MNDVIPECAGYLVGWITDSGFIMATIGNGGSMCVHRETLDMHLHNRGVHSTLDEAKSLVDPAVLHESWHNQALVLELNNKGGVKALWVRPDQVEDVNYRRNRFKGCYGAWPINTFTI